MTTSYSDVVSEQLPAANTTIYTAGILDSAHISSAVAFNSSAANVTIQVNVVQSSGAVAATNRYVSVTVPAGKPVILYELLNMTLKTGDFISAIAGAGSALNLKFTIKELLQ